MAAVYFPLAGLQANSCKRPSMTFSECPARAMTTQKLGDAKTEIAEAGSPEGSVCLTEPCLVLAGSPNQTASPSS